MRFGHDDEEAYRAARRELLTEFEAWASHQAGVDPASTIGSVDLLFDWRYGYSSGELDRLSVDDVDEYLLEWCPRKLSAPPAEWREVLAGVRAWVQFLVTTDRWRGGLVRPVLERLEEIEPAFLAAMGDPSNFGLAKGLFTGQASTGPLIGGPGPPPDPIEITVGAKPDPGEVAAAADRAPIVGQLDAMIEELGDGRPLTATGNLKLVDARRALEVWQTDDVADHTIGDREYKLRSAADLPHLCYLLHGARQAGALADRKNRLTPVQGWQQLDRITQVSQLFDALLAEGPIVGRSRHRLAFEGADDVVEDGLLHWMVPLLCGETVDVDELVAEVIDVVEAHVVRPWWGDSTDIRDRHLADLVEQCLDLVERCGLVTRGGHRFEPDDLGLGRLRKRGGTLAVTALGQHLLPSHVERVGYRLTTISDVADLDATELLETVSRLSDVDIDELWDRWRHGEAAGEKAQALADAIAAAGHPTIRLNGMVLLAAAGPSARGPIMRWFDTPLADHAAMFLLDHDLLDEQEVMARLGRAPVGMVVDLLASQLDGEGEGAMLAQWEELVAEGDPEAVGGLLDQLWRVDLPETPEVLTVLGRNITDEALAKAARKAALKARSRS